LLGDQLASRAGIGPRQIGDDRSTLADAEIAILQQGHLLPRIEPGVFRRLGLAGARADRLGLVGEVQLMHGPMRADRAAGAYAPEREVGSCGHLTISPQRAEGRARVSSRPWVADGRTNRP